MERETGAATPSGTPTGLAREAHHVQFQGFIFEVQVFSDQQISISFNEITASKIHESQQVTLKNINCKTVLAALKKEHPDIISAKVERCEDSYTLAVQVKYDFLPPIEEVVKFEARKVSDSEMSELEIRNYFHEIKDLSSKLNEIANCQVYTVDLKEKVKDFAIDMPTSKTLLTWSIQAKSTGNTIKLSISYLNTNTAAEKKSKLIPNDTISLYAPQSNGSVEMRFLLDPVEGYNKIVFRIDSNIKGHYNIITEKA